MKLAFLAQRHSVHTVRWVNALATKGHDLHLLSAHRQGEPLHKDVTLHILPSPPPAGYFLNVFALKRLLSKLQPDLLNTHFASGYGTLGRLSGFRPNLLSVWGSDVYDFPFRTPFHRKLIVANVRSADWICSTSHAMAEQVRTLFPVDHLSIIPFGVDTAYFSPQPEQRDSHYITVGTVKTLAHKYGIDLLIRAFANVRERLKDSDLGLFERLRLLIVGSGPDEAELLSLVQTLRVDDVTTFSSHVAHEQVPVYLNQLDIYVAASRLESFGVAVLEASACGLPVIVTNVGGLPEVVEDGLTGVVTPSEDVDKLAEALMQLVQDRGTRVRMGQAGRAYVRKRYDWAGNVAQMEAVYHQVLENYGS